MFQREKPKRVPKECEKNQLKSRKNKKTKKSNQIAITNQNQNQIYEFSTNGALKKRNNIQNEESFENFNYSSFQTCASIWH